jgi:hypothetical protein
VQGQQNLLPYHLQQQLSVLNTLSLQAAAAVVMATLAHTRAVAEAQEVLERML